MSEMHYWSAAEIAGKLESGEVSVTQITEAQIARIEAVNPEINAITTIVHEAMDVARDLDAKGRPDDAGPLWGVPVTTKINVDQTGYPNSNGVAAWANAVSDADSPVIANLKAAGAVIVGRTSTPEFSMRWFTENPNDGLSLNPWNKGITPGGSSGAAAAAVACGIGVIGHGNDLGGSLRYPAYCCGVATIRPSLGRIPAMNPTASAAGVERGPLTQLMAVQGPIARSIADVRAGLQVMAQRDGRDPLWTGAPSGRRKADGKLTVGYAVNPFGGPLDPGVEAAVLRAVAGFKDSGAILREIAPPHASDLPGLWGTLLFTESEALSRDTIKAEGTAEMWRYYRDVVAHFQTADTRGLLQAMQQRIVCQRAWEHMFEDIDILILPTSLQPPFRNEQDFKEPETLSDIISAQSPLMAINALGLPSAALPTHLENGIPLGVQLVGPMHQDDLVLDAAQRLEHELGTIWETLAENLTTE